MKSKFLTALAATAGLALAASQAHATVFTLDSINVTAHTADTDGLQVAINTVFSGPQSYDLSLPGADPSAPIALFDIYTTESWVNVGEDTVAQPIEVQFNFSSPTPNSVDPATGGTNGYVDGFTLLGHFFRTQQGGQLTWDNGGAFQMHYGNNLTGLMTIRLTDGSFNVGGPLGTDQGCGFLGCDCDPDAAGLRVYATLDWDNDPIGGVPEPGAWALMIMGFGAAGTALRRRRALAA